MSQIHHEAPGAKADFASDPPIGCTEVPSPAVLAKLGVADLTFTLAHPGPRPTRDEACLWAGAQTVTADVLGFGFEHASVFEHLHGWSVALCYRIDIDWTTAGRTFTEDALRGSTVLELSGSAALALFRGRDLLAGNPGLLGIACMAQRRAEMVGLTFKTALYDTLAITARILQANRTSIEQAAALVERDGFITRDMPGTAVLLAAARAVSVADMPPALEHERKLAGALAACRVDLGALAHEISQLAREGQP